MTETRLNLPLFCLLTGGTLGLAAERAGAAPAASPSAASPGAGAAGPGSFERAFLRGGAAPGWSSEPAATVPAGARAEAGATPESSLFDSAEWRRIADALEPAQDGAADASDEHAIPKHPALSDRFSFGLGVYAASSNTEARLDSPSGIGTTVDLEDVMGLDSNDIVPQGLARWRFSERWRLELEYFELNRSNSKSITGEIVWGDQTFPVNTVVNAQFDIAVARLSCGYSFFKREDKELGVALGFHVTDMSAQLSSGPANQEEGKLLAPLPVISLYGQFALTDDWAVAGRMDVFRLEYDPYAGHVFSIGLDAVWQAWRNVGFGLGWRSLEIEVSAENDDWKGEVGSSYQGPIVFMNVSF